MHSSASPNLVELLRDCYDPVLRRNIVDLRLVRSATLVPDPDNPPYGMPHFCAAIHLTAPSSDEAATAQLAAQIENRLLGVESISRVEIHIAPALFAIL